MKLAQMSELPSREKRRRKQMKARNSKKKNCRLEDEKTGWQNGEPENFTESKESSGGRVDEERKESASPKTHQFQGETLGEFRPEIFLELHPESDSQHVSKNCDIGVTQPESTPNSVNLKFSSFKAATEVNLEKNHQSIFPKIQMIPENSDDLDFQGQVNTPRVSQRGRDQMISKFCMDERKPQMMTCPASPAYPCLSVKSPEQEEGLETQTGGNFSEIGDDPGRSQMNILPFTELGMEQECMKEIYSRKREYECDCAINPNLDEECRICNNDNLMLCMADMPGIENVFNSPKSISTISEADPEHVNQYDQEMQDESIH